MNDETAIAPQSHTLASVSEQAEAFSQAVKLTAYQQSLRPQTFRRQGHDLTVFNTFLASVGAQKQDFLHNLSAWQGIRAGLLVAFLEWQKREGYAIGSINTRLATVKAYCHLAYDAGYLDMDTHTHIQGIKGIPRGKARNIDRAREQTRRNPENGKKAEPTDIPLHLLPSLKRPETGFFAKRDALMMCLLLDHGLRVGEIALLTKRNLNLAYINPQTGRRGLLTFYRPKVDNPQKDELTDDTYAAAVAYLATIPDSEESLFHLAVSTIELRVATIGKLVGLDKLSPHDCRHSWATRAAANGTLLERLKQAGGWSNLQTPLRYIRDAEIANEGVILE